MRKINRCTKCNHGKWSDESCRNIRCGKKARPQPVEWVEVGIEEGPTLFENAAVTLLIKHGWSVKDAHIIVKNYGKMSSLYLKGQGVAKAHGAYKILKNLIQ